MTDNKKINVVIYSYKNKNLKKVAATLFENTETTIHVNLIDQHPLKRDEQFADLPSYTYFHIFWDHIYSPIVPKADYAQGGDAEYTLILSDDVVLPLGWDKACIEFLNNHSRSVISGQGAGKIVAKDKYMIKMERSFSDDFSLTNYIDRNFIFAKTSTIKEINFPKHIKYYGEEEFLSLEFYTAGFDIYSMPSGSYEDLGVRSIENLYTPYSKEHYYNTFIDTITIPEMANGEKFVNASRTVSDFINFHNLDSLKIKKIPYQYDDVLYDPNKLEFQDTGGERFVATTKAIY